MMKEKSVFLLEKNKKKKKEKNIKSNPPPFPPPSQKPTNTLKKSKQDRRDASPVSSKAITKNAAQQLNKFIFSGFDLNYQKKGLYFITIHKFWLVLLTYPPQQPPQLAKITNGGHG